MKDLFYTVTNCGCVFDWGFVATISSVLLNKSNRQVEPDCVLLNGSLNVFPMDGAIRSRLERQSEDYLISWIEMSWQEYIDSSLIGSGTIAQAAIIGHNGDVWAKSDNFSLTPEECLNLIKSYDDPSDLRLHGLYLAGEKVSPYA